MERAEWRLQAQRREEEMGCGLKTMEEGREWRVERPE